MTRTIAIAMLAASVSTAQAQGIERLLPWALGAIHGAANARQAPLSSATVQAREERERTLHNFVSQMAMVPAEAVPAFCKIGRTADNRVPEFTDEQIQICT